MLLQIMKYQVDRFLPGKRVPACQLSVKWSGQQQQSVELMYSMKLVGAKEPFNFFFIQSPASTPIPGSYLPAFSIRLFIVFLIFQKTALYTVQVIIYNDMIVRWIPTERIKSTRKTMSATVVNAA